MTTESAATPKPIAIEGLYAARRRALPADKRAALTERPWGLALSGGGIRSATFCFGLIKALATNRLFHRFDFLSTVSGGGYIGSTVGRLFQEEGKENEPDPLAVEQGLAEAETRVFAAWLRANGRYLIPRGAKDMVFAAASFGRNLLGIHFELALLSLVLGSLLACADLLVWQWADCVFTSGDCWRPGWVDADVLGSLSRWPTLWLVLPLLAWVGALLACAFWAMPGGKGHGIGWQRPATAVFAAIGIMLLLRHTTPWLDALVPRWTGHVDLPGELVVLAAALLLAWIFGIALALGLSRSYAGRLDWVRNRLTATLAVALSFALIVVGLGIADYLAWTLGNLDGAKQGAFGGVLALVAVALRAALPKVADLPKSLTPGIRRIVMELLNVAGLLVLALVVIFWMSFVHRATSGVLFSKTPATLRFGPAFEWLGWILVPPLLMIVVSAANREFLNRSSLFTFYRARLVRSYLGAANPSRFGHPTCLARARDELMASHVTEVEPGDDVEMARYAPHLAGGPVHLINVCVNQTHDPKGGLFNQDRKGLLLTVGPQALMSVQGAVWSEPAPEASLTLGSWMAISGAAIAPGLGASTRSGVSAILMLAGLRLGYWWDSLGFGQRSMTRRTVGKYGQFLSELRGRFDGDERRDWFLSDGGHFENTAAYALLREQCELIVVADCGADPRYSFGDLENLVRKARIDLQADVTFLRPKGPHPELPAVFGSLNELSSEESQACLAMARIDYRHSGRTGYMFIVKPNMCHGVPVDLVNFKADNPLFPQEPTTDQFFSESQWESYFQLGQTLGGHIKLEQLKDAQEFAQSHFIDDDGAILVQDAQGKQTPQFSSKRLSSRIASTGAVSASVSLGAVASIGLAAWQAVDSQLHTKALESRIEPTAFKELTDIFGKLGPSAANASSPDSRLGEMATTLLRIGDAVCSPTNLAAFKQSDLMTLMVTQTKKACRDSNSTHAACQALLDDDKVSPCLQDRPRTSCTAMYWTRDYSAPAQKGTNCQEPTRQPEGQLDSASTALPSASSPVSSLPASSPGAIVTSPATPRPVCAGQTIYVQVYGPDRDLVGSLRRRWIEELGAASVPPVEDVWDSARRSGRRLSQPYAVPTVIWHQMDSIDCANGLAPANASPAWTVEPLASGLTSRQGIIEVWIPPTATSTAGPPPKLAYCYQEDDRIDSPARYGVHCHLTQAACEAARGPNMKRQQTACVETELPAASGVNFKRGWARSWYAQSAKPFGDPFPALQSTTPAKSP